MSTIAHDPKSFEDLFDQASIFVKGVKNAIEAAQKSNDLKKKLEDFLAKELESCKNIEKFNDFLKTIKEFASLRVNLINQKVGVMKKAAGKISKILDDILQSCASHLTNELCKANVSSALLQTYKELKELKSKDEFKDEEYDEG